MDFSGSTFGVGELVTGSSELTDGSGSVETVSTSTTVANCRRKKWIADTLNYTLAPQVKAASGSLAELRRRREAGC